MTEHEYDLCVIGAGSGGVRTARVAASLGARVVVAERAALGGTCVNLGCVPKKLLLYGAEVAHQLRDAAGYGWKVGAARFDWQTLIVRKNAEIARLNGVYRRLLEEAGVEILEGAACLVHRHRVEVGERRVSARYLVVATGGCAYLPEFPGRELVITSDQAFFLEALPSDVVVVGGGYIAVEFASIFCALGSAVTIVHRGDQLLRGFDDDVRTHLAAELVKTGVALKLGREVGSVSLEADTERRRVELSDGSSVAAECVLFATGRDPNTRGLGLSEVGVELGERGKVVVDEYGRTAVDNIYAVGDCTDVINLTPVALAEGQAVATSLFGAAPVAADRVGVPSAVFSHPPVGTVGLAEHEAQERHRDVDIYRSVFTPLKHTLTGCDEKAMMKLVVDRATDRVLGVHMVAPDAAEIIQGFAVALKCGATKRQLDRTIGVHPTGAEELVTMRVPLRARAAF